MGVPSDDFATQGVAVSAIEDAIGSWEDIDTDSLSVAYDGEDWGETNDPNDGVNIIFWSNHSSVSNLNGATLITAPTSGAEIGEFSDVDIVLNDGKRWTLNAARCGTDTVDVQSVVTHELGHALGLGHSTGKNTMTSSTGSTGWCDNYESDYEDPNLDQRTVTANDQDGYEYIYVNANSIRSRFGGGTGLKVVVADNPGERHRVETSIFPNPFNPEVTIAFRLEQPARVSAVLYDVLGQQVRTLAENTPRPAGSYQFVWDGRDSAGRSLSSGTYFFKLSVDDVAETRKLTLLR